MTARLVSATCYGSGMSARFVAVLAVVSLISAALSRQQQSGSNGPLPNFEDVTKKAGIDFTLDSGDAKRWFILESNSAGVIVIDYDNDGWPDLYFVNGSTIERLDAGQKSRGNRLYHNNRNGTFTDVTDRA